MDVIIWHNPQCSKSRKCLQLLEENHASITLRLYKEDPPTPQELTYVVENVEGGLMAIIRKKEAKIADIDLTANEDKIISQLSAHPGAIERPVVIVQNIVQNKVILGRPPENVLALFEE